MTRILIVDGYNIIHAWPDLMSLIRNNGLQAARDRLISEMEDYAGYTHTRVIIVFDAYHTDRLVLTQSSHNHVEIVFTRQKETADHYIERLCSELETMKYDVCVASSDAVEQIIVMGRGATRISARELDLELRRMKSERDSRMDHLAKSSRHTLESMIDPQTLASWRESLSKEEEAE